MGMGWPYQQKPPMGWPLDLDSFFAKFVGFWPMWGGSGNKVFDLSGNNNHGTLFGDIYGVPGKFGPALNFVGADDYVNFALPSVFTDISNRDHSISFWLNADDLAAHPTWTRILEARYDDNNYAQFQVQAENKIQFIVRYGGTRSRKSVHVTLSTGVWYHVVGVWNSATKTVSIYINGMVQTGAGTDSTGVGDKVQLRIGGRTDNVGDFDGRIDHTIIYSWALAVPQATQLYQMPFRMFKDPAEVALLGGYQAAPAGMAGAMTTNTGYWGW